MTYRGELPPQNLIFQLDPKMLIIDPKARGTWCTLPYPGHPQGCPNFGKKKGCPPDSGRFEELFQPPFYLVAECFDLKSHATKMKEKHPEWTEKQCRNLLYWQQSVKKKLKNKANNFKDQFLDVNLDLIESPEALGIDLFKTCEKIGISLKRHPDNVYKIMIVAKRK